MRRVLLLWALSLIGLQADPPDLSDVSPDGVWASQGHWVEQGLGGYAWTLKNLKTGKIYFDEKITPDEALPHSIEVLWSPSSRYAAITFEYGRAIEDVMVIPLTHHPDTIDPFPNNTKTPLENTLVHPDDLASFTGYSRLRTSGDHWVNDTDLSISIEMEAQLKGAAGQVHLDTNWHRTVRFEGKTPKLIDSVCDSYDKMAD